VILFWAILVLMVLAALAFVLPPLLGRGGAVGPQRAGVHRVLFRKRLAELETDLEDGALGPGQFEQARADLERDTLESLESADADAARPARRPRARWATALVVAVAIPVLAGLLYRQYGGWALLSPQTRARLAAEAVAQGDTDPALIRDMVADLAARMQRRPNDLQGWIQLGRSYRALKEFAQAAQAYAHAYRLSGGKNAAVIADYAEALALSRGNRLAGRPAQLVREALAVDPRQPKALWLAGWAAYQEGDYKHAVTPWKRLAAQAPRGSKVARILNREVARAEAMARGATPAQVAVAPGAGKGVTVRVSLAPRFVARTRPDETVFIFARAARGPPMSLAVVRRRVRDLPVTVTLDDSRAMMPGRTISKQREVIIGARISRSGNPLPAKGDLQGLSAPVVPGGKGLVRLTIDQVVP
jgi:cytochrome c-type biogenesis protein CcmH